MDAEKALVVFQGKNIRRVWHNNEWHFSVVDVVFALTDSKDAKDYWYQLKKREAEQGIELSTICRQLKLPSEDGKYYATDCANTESMFRIIQSIPSKKAEPFKQWLAKVGYERIQEIENPELAQKRVRGTAIRDELTHEWDKRGVKTNKEYSILTSEISKATFGLTPNRYKKFKGLKRENLRDHMNDLELIFSMLGEASATKIAKRKEVFGFDQNKAAAKEGGTVAGVARRELEKRSGEKVVSSENYLNEVE